MYERWRNQLFIYFLVTFVVVFLAILIINFIVNKLLRITNKTHWVMSIVASFVFTLIFIAILGL
ncbi:hypothetical protein FQ085_13875 [Planococcus sp. ANT_H30]|nr:hypothetical protein FQ085_13875 [Planococcus sp. ANT_H30]